MDDDEILNNKFKIGKLLGQGSYGCVFKAYDIHDPTKLYAIKQIKKEKIATQYLEEALEKEIKIMYELEHENSVKLYTCFSTEEYHNLVMELCDTDLDVLLKIHYNQTGKGFNELELWMIMNQFNKIFRKMKEKNIMHRDLKLKNIMVKKDPNVEIINFVVKLSDFGFSKKLQDDDITSTQLGTPITQAPEIQLGKHNRKVDLWSIGIMIYQLLFKKLPFVSTTKAELKKEILKWTSVKLPVNNNNHITERCFDLINRLLQKDPKKRIDFEDYFNHKFFSEEHKKKLIEEYYNKQNGNKKDNDNNPVIKEENNNQTNTEKKKIEIKEITDFDKKFKKLIPIKEYNGYILYKGKDLLNNKNVYIKEIPRLEIDKNEKNKKLFKKELELLSLLSSLKEKNFPEFIGLSKTDTHYNIIMEYFSGKILDDYIIYNKKELDQSFYNLIFSQLKPCFLEMKEKNISLDIITPKNFAFIFYENKTNFKIKIFDYGLIYAFCKQNDLTFKQENILNSKLENKNDIKKKEPIIKDEEIENIFEIIKNKINFVYDYFRKLFENNEDIFNNEIFSNYYKEIIIFLYFCALECQIIIKFLKINADTDVFQIDKTIQEIHLLKILLNKENDKYNYSKINFINEYENNNDSYFYNKENPTFNYYLKIFIDLNKKINDLYDIFEQICEKNLLNKDIEYESDNNQNVLISNFDLIDKENDSLNEKMSLENKFIKYSLEKGNIDKLFLKLFENVIFNYKFGKKDKIIDELNITKYLIEYIIFMKAIFGNKNEKVEMNKIFENNEDKEVVLSCTFLGGKINYLKEKKLLKYKKNDYNNSEIELNEEYDKMVRFYEKIEKLIKKIK